MKNHQFKNVFITGGAGYVGSSLVPKLLAEGYNVTVYDLFIYGDYLQNHPNLKKIKGDIRDRNKLIKAAKKSDAFIHLACISNDPSFDLDPKLGKSINFDAFRNVISAAKLADVNRFILASSTSQYGVKDPKMQVTEEETPEPKTDYARFKIECEKMLAEADLGKIVYAFIRPATICGFAPRLRLDLSVNILTVNALINKKIKIFGGSQLRPTLNIKDMVRIYELMLTAPAEKIHKQAFNVGYRNITIKELANLVKETLKDPKITFEITSTDDKRSYHINSDKIKRVLGFETKFTVEDAIVSIKEAYEKGLIIDGLNNPIYHNVKQMKLINLK